MVAAGQIAMTTGGFWVGNGLTNMMESRAAWGVVPHPFGLGPNPARGQQIHVDVPGINAASEHKNAAFRFIALACSAEGSFDLWQNTGFPSARLDVIKREEVRNDAHFQVFSKGLGESWAARQPANHRTQEFMRTIASGLQGVWVGDTTLDETLRIPPSCASTRNGRTYSATTSSISSSGAPSAPVAGTRKTLI